VYGHDLDQSEVTTDFNYRANKLQLDNFQRASFESVMWTVTGSPYILDEMYAVFLNNDTIYSNHLLRSKLFERISKLYINLINCEEDGSSVIYSTLKDGSAYVTVRVTVVKSGASLSISEIAVIYKFIDGDSTLVTDILPWTFTGLEKKEYILTLWQAREEKNLSLSIGLEQLDHPLEGQTQITVLLNKTFAHAVRVTGDYGFISRYIVETYNSYSMLLGLSYYEARSNENNVIYTPAEIV
jgi:hypothetical protein